MGGDRKGQYAIAINKQWRVCFEWHDNNAYHAKIVDYTSKGHKLRFFAGHEHQ
ncbi:MAG: type II toxin-antitoxin system RelE/ParE family toxin [Desulfobacteria bacterium]